MHRAFVAEEKSPGKSCKTISDDSGEGKVGFHKILNSKAEALLAKMGISWPWKGHEIDGGSGNNNVNSTQLHDKPENDQTHQRVPVLEPIIIPGCQDSEYTWASKYEVSGSWWDFNKDRASSMCSTGSTNSSGIDRVDYEADYFDDEIFWEDLVIGEQVGQGCCGTVYHALWHGSDVAAKVFSKQEYSEELLTTFRQEVSLMKKLRHPNIILFMGAVVSQQPLCIVTEFLPRGSLFQLLQNNIGKLDPRRRVNMAIDIARGMNYLHTSIPTIVHRDLKSPNLLVDKNWNVKVADFGLSRLKLETFLTTKTGKGTPQWMAPEVLRSEPSNEKSDVFSYGVVLWELVTQKIPWDTRNTMQVRFYYAYWFFTFCGVLEPTKILEDACLLVNGKCLPRSEIAVVAGKLSLFSASYFQRNSTSFAACMLQVVGAVGFMDDRLEIPTDTDPQWASMIQSCWDSDPQRRPSFQELLERLQDLQKQCTVQAQTERKRERRSAGKMSAKDES
uniref:Protein kinase domain-containing protein n=1 Tax=Triticum urartu TaxID=4572 RepID=A0A8R7U0Q3_TRIUA